VEIQGHNLEIKIENQPFVPYYDDSRGWNVGFYYNIHVKLHSSDKWIGLYNAEEGYPGQSDSEYTTLTLGHLGQNGLSIHAQNYAQNTEVLAAPSGDQVDFQVEAMTGHLARAGGPAFFYLEIVGDYSGWSRTQTLTVPAPSPTPTPTPTPLSEIIKTAAPVLAVIGAALIIGAIGVALRKHNKPKQTQAQLSRWQ
jgi:hypothetical protein